MTTRLLLPRVCGKSLNIFSAIREWNALPKIVKNAACETSLKKGNENLINEAKKV